MSLSSTADYLYSTLQYKKVLLVWEIRDAAKKRHRNSITNNLFNNFLIIYQSYLYIHH